MKNQIRIIKKWNRIVILFTSVLLGLISCDFNSNKNKVSIQIDSKEDKISLAQNDSLKDVIQFLINSSAKDFFNNQPPIPKDFRNVEFKFLDNKKNEKIYLICGQFLTYDSMNKEEWVSFTTIKTDPYEQWIGNNASSYCQDSKKVSHKISSDELSVKLKRKLDSLKN